MLVQGMRCVYFERHGTIIVLSTQPLTAAAVVVNIFYYCHELCCYGTNNTKPLWLNAFTGQSCTVQTEPAEVAGELECTIPAPLVQPLCRRGCNRRSVGRDEDAMESVGFVCWG